MNFSNRICQTLHDEHLANIALLQRIGQLLAQGRDPLAERRLAVAVAAAK